LERTPRPCRQPPGATLGYGEEWRSADACTLWAEGEVRQAAIFGEHLRLRRRVEAYLGCNTIRLVDTITNFGFDRTPHMLLYHVNLGWPLVDEGARFVAPIARILWRTDRVKAPFSWTQAWVRRGGDHRVAEQGDGFTRISGHRAPPIALRGWASSNPLHPAVQRAGFCWSPARRRR